MKPTALTHSFVTEASPVRRLTGQFSKEARLLRDFWNEWKLYSKFDQLSLSVPETLYDPKGMSHVQRLQYGCGNLKMLGRKDHDKDFVNLIRGAEFVQPIFDYIKSLGYTPSRPMLRCLQPKSCLSLHRDPTGVCFHLVLNTHVEAFFVVDNIVHRMVNEDYLYLLDTSTIHTAVNAHLTKPRLHFTVSGYKETV